MNPERTASIWKFTALGTICQLAMVVAGHYNAFVRISLFAVLGVAISLVFGALYGRVAAGKKDAALCGALVGGLSAAIGIAVSVALGDVPAAVLGFGTAGSAVTGLLGGLALRALAGPKPQSIHG